MASSRCSGLVKSHDTPPGPGRMSKAPAGRTPTRGCLSAAAVARGGKYISHTEARTSPGVAPAANKARA
eukprot:2281146-Alexandrium_andersonii.AAC.1